MAKRNKANEMSVEELIGNGMTVSKKFDVDPDTKNEFGMLLAQISQRYPSTSALRDAELHASVQHFVSEGKKGTRGTYELAEGTLDKIDLSSDMFIVDGIRIKMSNVYHLEVPDFDPEDMGEDENENEDEEEDEDEREDWDEEEDEDWTRTVAAMNTAPRITTMTVTAAGASTTMWRTRTASPIA